MTTTLLVLALLAAVGALIAAAAAWWQARAAARRQEETLARTYRDSADGLERLRNTVDNRLDAFTHVFAAAHDTITSVQQGLGEVRESSGQVRDLALNIKKLEELLRPPKARGVVGEILLENILNQILPPGQFHRQYPLAGATVDFVVKVGDKLVPIDAKFPLESFERFLAAEENDKRKARGEFTKVVRDKMADIAAKYIRPDLGTYDFALMYLPAENIYYEAFVADTNLHDYAAAKRVFPVSPSTVYVYLATIAVGLRGLALERKADVVWRELRRLSDELKRFQESFELVGKHLRNASNNYSEAASFLTAFAGNLGRAGQVTAEETPPAGPAAAEEPLFG